MLQLPSTHTHSTTPLLPSPCLLPPSPSPSPPMPPSLRRHIRSTTDSTACPTSLRKRPREVTFSTTDSRPVDRPNPSASNPHITAQPLTLTPPSQFSTVQFAPSVWRSSGHDLTPPLKRARPTTRPPPPHLGPGPPSRACCMPYGVTSPSIKSCIPSSNAVDRFCLSTCTCMCSTSVQIVPPTILTTSSIPTLPLSPKAWSRLQRRRLPQLPDEVVVSILRFIPLATTLARLRAVCTQWQRVIDTTPPVWRHVSFRRAMFTSRVARTTIAPYALYVGPPSGQAAVELAARSGNEWARFLHAVVFRGEGLRAFTAGQPLASMLVAGDVAVCERGFPPARVTSETEGECNVRDAWVAVHAARRSLREGEDVAMAVGRDDAGGRGVVGTTRGDVANWPRGAIVGLIHVSDAVHADGARADGGNGGKWIWRIDRAVSLNKPIRCAGFMGLWKTSRMLTELLVAAMHQQ